MPDPLHNHAEQLRSRLKWFLLVRVVITSLFLGGSAIVYLQSGAQRYAVSVTLLLAPSALLSHATRNSAIASFFVASA